jgi:hypothetical protein
MHGRVQPVTQRSRTPKTLTPGKLRREDLLALLNALKKLSVKIAAFTATPAIRAHRVHRQSHR